MNFSKKTFIALGLMIVATIAILSYFNIRSSKQISSDQKSDQANETPEQERARHEADPPKLLNLGVDFASMDGSDTGSFYVPEDAAKKNLFNNSRPVDPFGSTFGTAPGAEGDSSSINFWIKPDATLIAPMRGIVTDVQWQEDSKDFEVNFKRTESDWWSLSFDHVLPLDGDRTKFEALVGTTITAGAPIARPSIQSVIGKGIGKLGESIHGFVELQLNFQRFHGDTNLYFQEWHCPALFLEPATRKILDKKIRILESRWEKGKNNQAVYDESQMPDTPACVTKKLTRDLNQP